jgi:hypothetical protein
MPLKPTIPVADNDARPHASDYIAVLDEALVPHHPHCHASTGVHSNFAALLRGQSTIQAAFRCQVSSIFANPYPLSLTRSPTFKIHLRWRVLPLLRLRIYGGLITGFRFVGITELG